MLYKNYFNDVLFLMITFNNNLCVYDLSPGTGHLFEKLLLLIYRYEFKTIS